MKRIVILIAVAVAAMTASARDTEVSVSYGALPAMSQIAEYHDHWHGMNHCWGAVNFTIDHRFADNLWVGLNYTFSTADSNYAYADRYGKVTWHGLMVNVRYEWARIASLKLYSHAGVGALVEYYTPSWGDTYNRTHIGFQASPIGAEYDLTPHVGVFAEAGYGVQGVIKAGIRVGF